MRTLNARTFNPWTFRSRTLAGGGGTVVVAEITKRLVIFGTSRERFTVAGTARTRLQLAGTSQERLTLDGSSP